MKKPVYDDGWPGEVKVLYQHDIERFSHKTLVPIPSEWN